MRKFVSGILTGVAIILLLVFYVRFGFVDSRADIPVNRLEQTIAMPSLDASVARHAPDIRNPLNPSEANLIAGMKIYQANCANCHGDVNHPEGPLADAFYPRAPQFVQDHRICLRIRIFMLFNMASVEPECPMEAIAQ